MWKSIKSPCGVRKNASTSIVEKKGWKNGVFPENCFSTGEVFLFPWKCGKNGIRFV